MGPLFNWIIDNVLSASFRFLELPFLILLPALVGIYLALSGLAFWLLKRTGKPISTRLVKYGGLLLVLLIASLMADYKIAGRFKEREQDLSRKTNLYGLIKNMVRIKRSHFLEDYSRLDEKVNRLFGENRMVPLVYDESTDIIFLNITAPKSQIFIAIIDLNYPGLRIVVDPEIRGKWLTSRFSRQNDCIVAINGEAGRSARLDSGLGKWTGNLICNGTPVLLQDNGHRPFLSFDKGNHARFYRSQVIDTTVTPEKYNTIWGRIDILIDGKVVPPRHVWNLRWPSTSMSINDSGNRLYLVVVDGRRPDYSIGLNLEELGTLHRALGAYNGMACDGGGSACMDLSKFGGIINFPADFQERPTYTHFGIKINQHENNSQ